MKTTGELLETVQVRITLFRSGACFATFSYKDTDPANDVTIAFVRRTDDAAGDVVDALSRHLCGWAAIGRLGIGRAQMEHGW